MRGRRLERVGELLHQVIAEILTELKDPRLGFVTVNRVNVSADLQHAKVFVSVLGDDEQVRQSMEGLKSAAGFVRRALSGRIELRYLPELSFLYDESIKEGTRIISLIQQVCPPGQTTKPSQ